MKKRFVYGLLAACAGMFFLTAPSVLANNLSPNERADASRDGSAMGVAVVSEGAGSAVMKVPFMFAVGGDVLPSGTYRVAPQGDDAEMLQIANVDNHKQALVGTLWERASNVGQQARLFFKDYNGAEILAAVSLPGESVRSIPMSEKTVEKDLRAMALIRFRTETYRQPSASQQ